MTKLYEYQCDRCARTIKQSNMVSPTCPDCNDYMYFVKVENNE